MTDKPLRVAATLIVLNTDPELKNLKALFDSTDKVGTTDYFIALDDKSHPITKTWLKNRLTNLTLVDYTFEDDFGKARNIVTELVQKSQEITWFYWIDSDDTLVSRDGKTLGEFLSTIPSDVNSIWAEYLYEQDEWGNARTLLVRKRILRNSSGWFWRNRVHEDVHENNPSGHGEIASTQEFQWVHNSDGREPNDRNFRILAKAIAEEPDNPRNYYYLGNQHFAAHHWPRAAENYEKYLTMSNWDDEKWHAAVFLAIAYRSMAMYNEAISADTRAMLLKPEWADSYFGLGETYARLERWEEARHWGETGLHLISKGVGVPDPLVFNNSLAYTHNPYQWLAVVYANLGQNDLALDALRMAYSKRPEPETKLKIDHLEWAMEREKAISQGLSLSAALIKRNEPLKARAVLESLPAGAEDQNPMVSRAKLITRSKISHLDNKTVYKNLYYSEQKESMDPIEELKHMNAYPRIRWVLKRLKEAGAKRVLEFGVGNALSSLYYASNGISIIGLDVDPQRVKDANWSAVKLGFQKTVYDKRIQVKVPDLRGMAVFHVGTEDNIHPEAKGPFDAIIATELIEHVVDPEKLLDALDSFGARVILSTPDGAFSGPQEINPSHVRMYSQREFTALLMKRGRLVSMYQVAHPNIGEQGNLVAEYLPKQPWQGDPVVIYCGNTGQGWTPESLTEGGIGGSETAVVRVAEELTKRGKLVHVYGECEGIYNGVRYSHVSDFKPYPCQLFLSWRSPGPIGVMRELAKHRWMWAHDVTLGPLTDEELKGTKIIALTDWHREKLLEQYPKASIFVAGNGIDPQRFTREILCEPCQAGLPHFKSSNKKKTSYSCAKCGAPIRKAHRIIYAQSPDRGLDVILSWWPEIKDKYPDAELRVFYGFDMARRVRPSFIQMVEDRAHFNPGVFLKGRVGQDELAEQYRRAGVALMPEQTPEGKPFPETYNISAVEAQAAGCMVIGVKYAGLAETNKCLTVDDPSKMKDALLTYWKNPKKYELTLGRAQKWANEQTWERVAETFIANLNPNSVQGRTEAVEEIAAVGAGA